LKDLIEKYPEQVFPLKLDVTDYDEVHLAVESAIAHFGRIDVLVNNAGFGIVGAAEAFTDEQVRSQLETNLYAPIEITRAVLPFMRKQKSGRILQISSIGGRVGNAGVSIYQAAKFGLSGFSEVLAKEVADLGILVTSVEPGGFRTDWAGDSMTYAPRIEGYDLVDKRSDFFQSKDFVPTGDPEKAAQVMINLVDNPEPPVHLVLGSEAIGMLKHADATRTAEMEKWMDVSLSTDHDDSTNFLDTDLGKSFIKR
ncbi:MAG: SDR family NAD(P)-dependent oxidoreductase, partial [Chitinophagaceae bacterium]